MIKTFITSFKLRDTYKANSILYTLRSIPFVKKLFPNFLYGSSGIKVFAHIISIFLELGSIFLGKALYLLVIVFLPLFLLKIDGADTFLHLIFFLTVIGGLLNTHMFNPTKDKYYAMFLMRMDAKEYTLSNYLYFLLKMLVGFLPFTLLLGALVGVQVGTCFVIPLFICSVKLIITAFTLLGCKDGEKVRSENLPISVVWVGVAAMLAAAYLPVVLGYSINEAFFLIASAVVIVAGLVSLVYILRFRHYRAIYRTLLTANDFAMNRVDTKEIQRDSFRKTITVDTSQVSHQSGYKYFNELFMKRHSKLLTKSAKKISLIAIGVIVVGVVACFIAPEAKSKINTLMLTYLPYFLFLMYFINRGQSITYALFLNCDASMLTYRFYRQPKSILALFWERLKYITTINLMPASVIALGLPLLLYVSGGTANPVNYGILFVSILTMSVFFSVHSLVLYYLLQPYNANMETKNPIYQILNGATYLVCYFALGKQASTLMFGLLISVFCILYVLAALFLAYRLAPKTFKLR